MTSNNCKPIHLFLFLFALLVPGTASSYNLKRISKQDGLSNSAILSMCQDRDGYMWFGSCDGVNMYDGLKIKVFKPAGGPNSLSGNIIEDIVEAGDGVFWIQTNYGLDRFDKRAGTVESYTVYRSNYKLRTSRIAELFFIRENGFLVYYNSFSGMFRQVRLQDIDPSGILEYTMSDDGVLWIFCRNGNTRTYNITIKENHDLQLSPVMIFDHDRPLEYCFHQGSSVFFIDDGRIFYEYDLDGRTKYYIADLDRELPDKKDISAIIRHHDDYFIGMRTDGLVCLRYTPDKPENYHVERIEVNSGIFCLVHDSRQDIVWIGTDGQGVFIYSNDPYSFKSVTLQDFTHRVNKPVRALTVDRSGSLWLGTKGDGIARIADFDFDTPVDPSSVTYYNTGNSGLSDNSVYFISERPDGSLWIGTENGLDRYDPRNGQISSVEIYADGEPVRFVHSVYEQGDTVLWIATVGTGIVKCGIRWHGGIPQPGPAKRFTIRDGIMSSNYFFTIFPANDSTVWFGNRGYGAFVMDTESERLTSVRLDKDSGDRTLNDVFSIITDDHGNTWFGTSYGLVKLAADGKQTVFNEEHGLPNNTVHGILTDPGEDLWLSTNSGLVKFDSRLNTFLTFGRNYGLEVVEFSDGAYFSHPGEDMLLFGGINGFVAVKDNNHYKRNEYLPAIVLNGLSIMGEQANIYDFLDDPAQATLPEYDRHRSRRLQPRLTLNHDQNFFSLTLTAVDYINGTNYSYLYMLEGLNETWIENGQNNIIHFTDVAPGEYRLLVKYRNRQSGVESPVHILVLRIRPPWFLSAGAYAIYSAVILLGLFLILREYVRQNDRRREKMLEAIRQQHQRDVYESKLKFFTNIAHEFCTPLTLIHGPCERIIQYRNSDQFVLKYAGLIHRNAERMNELIQQLIDFRRIETGNRPPSIARTAVSDLAANIFESFTELAESRTIDYWRRIDQGLIWNTDKDFLETILANLLSNAFKYTNRNGTVSLTVREEGRRLRITVSNTGKGIKAENIGKVFDRYTILEDFENQNEKAGARNGLGLAISYSMVNLLGGDIDVVSVPDRTTDFIVSLPLPEITDQGGNVPPVIKPVGPTGEVPQPVELPRYGFDKGRSTILLVDDEKEMLWFLCEIFSQEYNVIPVEKPLEVDKILTEIHPSVIICDVMMPGLDGISLTRQIKGNPKTAHIPMILVSAKHKVEEQIEGLDAGAEMYITKPFNIDYLRIFVKHLISRKETLKEYFSSPLSAYELTEGKMMHLDHRKFIQKILEIINANIINKDLSAKFIADRMNMSTRHLYRKINEIGAQSPAEMIRECRLHIAQDLLKNTKLNIDEIIFKSGFANRGPFFRAFSAKFGCTLKEFRERNSGI
ncbi:MAG: ATP-binding protein [Alistipes sp.]|nr:ATP-binding protein [Alistipes sp.]